MQGLPQATNAMICVAIVTNNPPAVMLLPVHKTEILVLVILRIKQQVVESTLLARCSLIKILFVCFNTDWYCVEEEHCL